MSDDTGGPRSDFRVVQGGQHAELADDHVARTPGPDGAPVSLVDEAHNSCGSVYVRSDRIVVSLPGGQKHIEGTPLTLGDVRQAQGLVKEALTATAKPRLLLVDAQRVVKDTAETRRVEQVYDLTAMAIIIRKPLHRIGASIWMRRTRFAYPVRVFSSAELAVAWLNICRETK